MATILVVGASRGLGKALADEHRRRGWEVIGTVRRGTPSATTKILDVTDGDAIDALRRDLTEPIDRLFVVAGITGPDGPIGDVEPAAFCETLLTNTLGALRVADRLADAVTEDGLIAVMSSSLGSIAGNDDGGYEVYRISKAALNMGLRSLVARRADDRTWLAVNPGYVRTDMTGDQATLTIDESIPRVVDRLDERSGTTRSTGLTFVDVSGDEIPW